MEVSLDRAGGEKQAVRESYVPFTPPRDSSPGAVSLSGDGADHVRLQPVLFLLRGAERARAGAKPPWPAKSSRK